MTDKPVSLTWDYASNLPREIRVDPLRLKQVLMNFASNAVKFTQQGEISLAAHCDACSDGQARLVFSLQDTGIGIVFDQLEEIFRPFGQADSSTTRQFGGTGLGLSIAHRLAEQMGGTLDVDSQAGQGACFAFTVNVPFRGFDEQKADLHPIQIVGGGGPLRQLRQMAERAGFALQEGGAEPCVSVESDHVIFSLGKDGGEVREKLDLPITHREFSEALRGLEQTGAAPIVPAASLTGCDVLVVEDNRINLSVFVALVEALGARVRSAKNGLEAVEQVALTMPDVILMDLHMPLMDGHRAFQVLRADHGERLVPVVAASANATPAESERCRKAGFTDFLPKPVDPYRLREVLEQAVEHRGDPVQLNRARGLMFAGGDKVLCAQTLGRFHDSLEVWSRDFAGLDDVAASEYPRDLLHVIKGAAGTVGAERLVMLTEQAEAGQTTLTVMVEEMESLLCMLDDTHDANPDISQGGQVSLEQLLIMISAHDMAALDAVCELEDFPGEIADRTALIEALRRLDFRGAEGVISRLEQSSHKA